MKLINWLDNYNQHNSPNLMNNSDFPYIAIWNMHGEVLPFDPSPSFQKQLTINNDMLNGRCRNDHGH